MLNKLTKEDILKLSITNSVSIKDIYIFISHFLDISYSQAFFLKEVEFNETQYKQIQNAIQRRQKQEPIAKIIEKKEFYSLKFKTNKYTLDPRPETELLIDAFQKYFPDKTQKLKILDLGTGTGCIGLTILSLYKNAFAVLSDISEQALNIAKHNSISLNLSDKCKIIRSNWFENITSTYDIILSNPPYVSPSFQLDNETLYDPKIALFAENNGLSEYEKILKQAPNYMHDNSVLLLEIGFNQKDDILNLETDLHFIEALKDLSNINRTLVFSFSPKR